VSARPRSAAQLTCFVTATALPPADDNTKSDALFRDLYGLTAKGASNLGYVARDAQRLLEGVKKNEIIKGPDAALPSSFDATVNDGIVTSVCQIAHPDRPTEFGGLVIGDHGDVLGHYPASIR